MKTKELTTIFSFLMRFTGALIVVGFATCLAWLAFFLSMSLMSSILFFQGCFATALSFLGITGAFLIAVRCKRIRPDLAGVAIGLAGLYLGGIMTLFVVLPVSYDRSVSIFLLSRIAASGLRGVSTSELESDLIQRYVVEQQAVARRMKEQLATGTIENLSADRFTITPRGTRLLCINPLLERLFRYHNPMLANVCSSGTIR